MSSGVSNGLAVTEALIDNILKTRFEDISPEVVHNTKWRILDMVGNAIAGARCDGNRELAELVRGWQGKREATILGYGSKGPAHDVAFVNCIFGRSFDRGPLTYIYYGQRSPNHITETSALTALAMGESEGISGKELITACVVGDDLAGRLHLCIDRAQPGQTLPPGTPPPPPARGSEEAFAATAIAGRILGLNSKQLKNAFGIATMLRSGAGGGMPQLGTPQSSRPASRDSSEGASQRQGWQGIKDPSFIAAMERARDADNEKNVGTKLSNGITARIGINAAQLAQAGWPGVKDPFFGQNGGHYPSLASVHHPDRITKELGKEYIVEVCFKPYPGGRPTAAPTQAALSIAKNHNINTDDIAEVILHLSPVATAAHYSTPYVIGDYPTMNALWSYYFCVASALYRKSATAENFTEAKIRDPKLQTLVKKVKLGYLDKPEGIELEVVMKDGRRLSEYVRMAYGDPSNPISRDDLIAKFMEQVEFSRLVNKKDAQRLIGVLDELEEVDNVKTITDLAARHR